MANSILYGLMNQKDLAANLTAQNLIVKIDPELVVATTIETVDQHNREINALRAIFAGDTTDYTLGYKSVLNNDLQEGDENQNPEPVKGAGVSTVGFPIRIATTKWGANYTTLEQMTVQDYSDRTDQMLIGDVNWNRKWTFGTLLFDGLSGAGPGTSPYVFADPKYGNINIYGLANGDAQTYNKFSSQSGATDTHYTAQNGAISDTTGQNPFPTIQAALLEHPENTGPLVSFIDPALATSVKALAGFTPVPTLALATPGVTTPTFNGTIPVALPPSAQLIGVYGDIYIVTWRSVPVNHIITRAYGSPAPLLYRQYKEASLQGFGPVGYANRNFGTKFPYFEQVWYRAGGLGGYNRVGAHVHQIGSSTTYSMPSPYYALFGRTS
jgi:hypothetical protein